jgi:hypothetical protein
MAALFPGPQRPSTAVPGIGDEHDDNIYSALVLAHGGVGTQTLFLAGQGSPIPQMTSTAITGANLPSHYQTYTAQTTVIQQSGQLGNSVGDASVRAIGVTIDQAAVTGGVPRVWGATAYEVVDICSKTRLEIKLSQKRRILGPVWTYPQVGGAAGFTTANATSLVGNGFFATGRRIASRFEIARNDTLTADITADAALAFSDTSFATTHAGQASLVWVMMIATVRSDVR